MKRLWHWACRLASGPRGPWLVGLALLVLTSPALFGRLINDDLTQRLILQGDPAAGPAFTSPFQMFDFAGGTSERTAARIEAGHLPWWTLPELKYRFLRPAAVLTHLLDYTLWPNAPWLMHLHSMLWGAACVVLAAYWYRRILPSALPAGAAALLYAIDDARAVPIASICNRNSLIGLFFALLLMLSHDRWRRDGRWAGLAFGCAALVAGLLANEGAVAIGGYLLGYALFVDRGPILRRLMALLPYGVIVLAWRTAYGHLGYGVSGSLSHTDPGAFPLTFLGNLPGYASALLLGQWLPLPAELYFIYPTPVRAAVVVLALALAIAFFRLLLPHLRREPALRMCALGMVLATLPAATTLPDDRSLLFIGLGAMPLIATLILGRVRDGEAGDAAPGRARRSLVGLLVACHLVLAPLLLPLRVAVVDLVGGLLNDTIAALELDEGNLENQTVAVVNAPVMGIAPGIAILRAIEGKPVPARVRDLGPNFPAEPLTLERPDEYTLVVSRPGGVPQIFFRGQPEFNYTAGDVVELSDVTITIRDITEGGLPRRVSYRFNVPLEDGALQWVVYEAGRLRPFLPPAVGEDVVL